MLTCNSSFSFVLCLFFRPFYAGAAGGESPEVDPHYFDALPHRPRSAASDQWSWIEQQLSASTAQYLLVGGHYSL